MQKIAVTGANGHIGNVLCRELIKQGHTVNAMVHQRTHSLDGIKLNNVKSDLSNSSSLDQLLEGVDTVFHLAAKISLHKKDEKEVFKINLDGTHNIIEACIRNGVKTLVHFSSIHVLDPFPLHEQLDENRKYNSHSTLAYEMSKLESEKLVLNVYQLRVVVIIPTSVIGPYDFGPSLIGQAFIKMFNGKLPMVLPYGFNWVDVRDIAVASIVAADKAEHRARYILSNEWKTLPQLAGIISNLNGKGKLPMICPPIIAHTAVPIMDWCLRNLGKESLYNKVSLDILRDSPTNISYQKASKELNYRPRSVEQSIQNAISWYKSNRKL